MIKFFRHARQSLVMENKTGKYFKYAIGEIILVVIGILIALQINNWNEHEKNRRTEIIFLNGILSDIGEQKQLIKEQQNWESNKLKEAFSCLDIIKTNTLQSNIDSLYFIMERLNPRKTFSVFNPTFEEIKSTGGFKLFTEKKLKTAIILFNQNLERSNQIITNNNFNIDNVYKPFTQNNTAGFYQTPNGTWNIDWINKSTQQIQLLNTLTMRKNLAGSNLNQANTLLIELNNLEVKILDFLNHK